VREIACLLLTCWLNKRNPLRAVNMSFFLFTLHSPKGNKLFFFFVSPTKWQAATIITITIKKKEAHSKLLWLSQQQQHEQHEEEPEEPLSLTIPFPTFPFHVMTPVLPTPLVSRHYKTPKVQNQLEIPYLRIDYSLTCNQRKCYCYRV